MPLHFERNIGQGDRGFDFVATGAGYRVGLAPLGPTIALTDGSSDTALLRFGLVGARPGVASTLDTLPGTASYYRGNDPAHWQVQASTHGRVRYAGVYDGIDVVYYGNQRRLQYDFHVAPGADPRRVAFAVEGADRVSLDDEGHLRVQVGDRVLVQERPFTYQVVGAERREVPSRFVVDGTTVRFDVGAYDRARELVIDPVIAYSSWFGGSGEEGVLDLAIAPDGGIVTYGFTIDLEGPVKFPTTAGAVKSTRPDGNGDAFVTKFNAAGSAILFSTLIGGSEHENIQAYGHVGGLAVDSAGEHPHHRHDALGEFPDHGRGVRHRLRRRRTGRQRLRRRVLHAAVLDGRPAGVDLLRRTSPGDRVRSRRRRGR